MLDLLYIYIYTRVKSEFSFFAPPLPLLLPVPYSFTTDHVAIFVSRARNHWIIHDQGSLESRRRRIDDLEYYGDWPA